MEKTMQSRKLSLPKGEGMSFKPKLVNATNILVSSVGGSYGGMATAAPTIKKRIVKASN